MDDLDGFVGALVAEQLDLPYVGYVVKVESQNGGISVRKEYPGGLNADLDVQLPAVVGVQAAEKPPRYVVTSKVMEAMKSSELEEQDSEAVSPEFDSLVTRMAIPESGTRAEMIEGSVEEVAEALARLFREKGRDQLTMETLG